jgi:alpha-N-arabinofuranosidase
LSVTPQALSLATLLNPSFLARRQQHFRFDASTSLELPAVSGVAAGMAAFQSEQYWYFLGARRTGGGVQLFLEKSNGGRIETIATVTIPAALELGLRISGDEANYSFYYDADGDGWTPLRLDDEGSILSTAVAGGFVGAVLGLHARIEQVDADAATGTDGQ